MKRGSPDSEFGEDVFTMLAELALDYAGRRLKGEHPKLKVHFEFEDAAEDTDEEVRRIPHKRAGADDRPRKAATAKRVRRQAVR